MRCPPVTLTVLILKRSATSAMARNFIRRRHAAPHARHDGERAVLLDVGVHPLVDEARLRVVAVFAGPGAQQVVVERRPARRAAARGLPAELLPHGGNRFQHLRQDEAPHLLMRQVDAGAHRLAAHRRIRVSQSRSEQRLHLRGALPARGRSLGLRTDVVECRQPPGRDGLGDHALADAVAAADFRVVREPRDGRPPDRAPRRPDRPGRRSACRAAPTRLRSFSGDRSTTTRRRYRHTAPRRRCGCCAARRACRRHAPDREARSRRSRCLPRNRPRKTGRRR